MTRTTSIQWQNLTNDALFNAARRVERFYNNGIQIQRGTVRTQVGISEYTFSFGRDCKWRLTYVSNYGNGSMVSGEGCDASGYVVTDKAALAMLVTLNNLNQ